jgi:hypothetical protein
MWNKTPIRCDEQPLTLKSSPIDPSWENREMGNYYGGIYVYVVNWEPSLWQSYNPTERSSCAICIPNTLSRMYHLFQESLAFV